MKLTLENISALFNCNAPNSAQMHLLGLPRKLKSGWMRGLVGKEIPNWMYARALELKGRKPKGAIRTEWRKGELEFDPDSQRQKPVPRQTQQGIYQDDDGDDHDDHLDDLPEGFRDSDVGDDPQNQPDDHAQHKELNEEAK